MLNRNYKNYSEKNEMLNSHQLKQMNAIIQLYYGCQALKPNASKQNWHMTTGISPQKQYMKFVTNLVCH